ncbi:glutamate--cysteine ligase [uncultured Jatrophihabitans sp.]|uniref:carboxylate-amine ligase n=1 Tax=uncultured Jatrophihabitans sp. TaxID=1610747 RepID=UPI0035CB3CF9
MTRTVGVEEEFFLFAVDEGRLRPAGEPVADAADRRSDGQFEHELKREQAELGTKPHRDLAALRAELRERRAELGRAAAERGVRVVAVGTPPVESVASVTPDRRYERMHEVYGDTARTALTCGMHVHVGVGSREEGVRALNGVRGWLPVLLALTANSPYADGRDTGYASQRSMIWQRWPTAGPFELFHDLEDYDRTRAALVETGAALDDAMLYFDARLSATYPTLEIRAADVCARVEDAVTVAALARALVDSAAAGALPPPTGVLARVELVRAATWRAARYGLTDELVSPLTGDPTAAGEVVGSLLELVGESLRSAGDADVARDGVARILERGTGSDLQRRVLAERGELSAVVDVLAACTLA